MTDNSIGYKILRTNYKLNSPYKFLPKKQKEFEEETAKKLAEKYPEEKVKQVIQELSPLGVHNKNYGAEIMREVRTGGR